jgi:glycosyltransferase involved in cell wall biosynthesis
VRESYLAAIRNGGSAGSRFAATRLARGLARCAYAGADVVAPVTDANAHWEVGFGIDPSRILVLYNGLDRPAVPVPPPGAGRVVSVGRIDPLKDVHTMLRVAAEALRSVPDAEFLHYGPRTDGEEAYWRSCLAVHAQLGLGDRFRFMGSTDDPTGVMRAADLVLMTSISEGLPMSILEAMSQGRPVISTGVGGVPDVVKGCGAVLMPGDEHGLAMAIVTLLRNPALAWQIGRLGHKRLARIFSGAACVEGYRELLRVLAGSPARTVAEEGALT